MANFDTKTMYNFEKYLMLQKSGEVNMLSPMAREKLGFSKEELHYIVENYDVLLNEYNELKVVDELLEDAKERVNANSVKDKEMSFKTAEHSEFRH